MSTIMQSDTEKQTRKILLHDHVIKSTVNTKDTDTTISFHIYSDGSGVLYVNGLRKYFFDVRGNLLEARG